MRQAHTLSTLVLSLAIAAQSLGQIAAAVPKGTTRAVVVGISRYENITGLRFAHRDAQEFAAYLRSPGGGEVPESNVKLLIEESATQGQIGAALTWLLELSEAGDQAIIFFSGHGDVESVMNEGYLLAYNANKHSYMSGGAIPIHTLQRVVAILGERKVEVLLVTDACRSGQLAGGMGGVSSTANMLRNPFSDETKFLSCHPNELSLESEEWGGGRSVFAYFLLEGLRGKADRDEDRRVTLREIKLYLEEKVYESTVALRPQNPIVVGNPNKVLAKLGARPRTEPTPEPDTKPSAMPGDTTPPGIVNSFEAALRKGDLMGPEAESALNLYRWATENPAMKPYRNGMRNDLAAALQDEAQKAINDYLSADPREMRRRWALDDSRYQRYPSYLAKAAELYGESHFSYSPIKAREHYFAGLNLRLQAERSSGKALKDSLFTAAKALQFKTLGLDSTAAHAHNELGLLARRLGLFEASVAHFAQAQRFSPTWVLPWANMCDSYSELGRSDDAERCGLKAVALDSTSALAHYNLGYVYLSKKNEAQATHHFLKTIEYQTDYANAYYNLGFSYYGQKSFKQAEEMWEAYRQKVPNDPDVLISLGQVGFDLGKGTAYAENFYRQALAIDPAHAKASLSMGELALEQKDYASAAEWLNKYIALDPEGSAYGYFLLAKAQHGNPDAALRSLESAFSKGFRDTEGLNNEPLLAKIRSKPGYKSLVAKYLQK